MRFSIVLIFVFSMLGLHGQIKHPKASPFNSISQDVGLTTIKVEYSRPAVKGRTIFGELVPFGRIWRVGANASTKITFQNDVLVDGKSLRKGRYALYAFPEEQNWQLVFHKNINHWGDGRKAYNSMEDALRVVVIPKEVNLHQENFLISFDSITHDSAQLVLHWGKVQVRLKLKVNTQLAMEEEIAKVIQENPTSQTYYEAARYYQEEGLKPKLALKYLKLALELGGDTYYFHRVKSLVEAQLADYSAAIISAQKSKELALIEEKDEFVRMNERNIVLWRTKMEKP